MKMKQTLALLAWAMLLSSCSGGDSTPPSPHHLDMTPPVITLLGDNPQIIMTGTAYTELGATAIDDVDGDISELIVINANAVDISTAGSYSVTYDVTDSSGNAAHTISRTVSIQDFEATNPGGIWQGEITWPSHEWSIRLYGVLTETGEGRFQGKSGDNIVDYIIDNVSGYDGNVTINFTAIVQSGNVFLDGSEVTGGSISGTVVERSSITGTFLLGSGESGTVLLYYQILYSRDSSLTKLEGTWYEDSYASATFNPDGSFFWQDRFGCVYDGQASIIDPDYNAYALAMTVSLCSVLANGQYSGQGILMDQPHPDSRDDLFLLWMNNGARMYVIYLYTW